jgi:molecular chaperone GrpE
MRRFAALLDSAFTSDAPPPGIDEQILSAVLSRDEAGSGPQGDKGGQDNDRRCDSYALWAAMTALTQEIKLQGRTFQDLNLTLTAQTEKIAEELRAVYAERERTLQREIERRCRREILSALIDLRDRLGRGCESVRAREAAIAVAVRPAWWARLWREPSVDPWRESLAALVRGYELGIERLDQTLDEFNAREIQCQGQSFDPRRMNAIESEESVALPDGTVIEVYRSGYEWNGEVFRPAQVKVSRAPANDE